MENWRLLLSGPGHPCQNMAIDEAILEIKDTPPTFRLYAWDPPAISLGYFQDYKVFHGHDILIVRRITGGGAIYHKDDLTYSLITKETFFQGLGKRASYQILNRVIIKALTELGIDAREPQGKSLDRDSLAGYCFDTLAGIDLSANGKKIAGSAQRRKGGKVLQHGSIPLAKNLLAKGAIAVGELIQKNVTFEEMADVMKKSFEEVLSIHLHPSGLSPIENELALQLEREKYSTVAWNQEKKTTVFAG